MAIEIGSFATTNDLQKPDSMEDLLSGYSSPKTETPAPVNEQEAPPAEINQEQFATPPNPDAWIGDKRYYQRGAKAGQLRPGGVRATYNHNATSTIPATMLINGALFLSVINFIIPLTIVTINNWVSPKEKMTLKDLRLTNEEKKEIDPLMDATLKQLNIQGNPLILLMITLTAAYSMKFIGKKVDIETENLEAKTEQK